MDARELESIKDYKKQLSPFKQACRKNRGRPHEYVYGIDGDAFCQYCNKTYIVMIEKRNIETCNKKNVDFIPSKTLTIGSNFTSHCGVKFNIEYDDTRKYHNSDIKPVDFELRMLEKITGKGFYKTRKARIPRDKSKNRIDIHDVPWYKIIHGMQNSYALMLKHPSIDYKIAQEKKFKVNHAYIMKWYKLEYKKHEAFKSRILPVYDCIATPQNMAIEKCNAIAPHVIDHINAHRAVGLIRREHGKLVDNQWINEG